MGKKHKHPEHINLERWLISYADFITLLFATFVVLYALSQVDIKDFQALEDSLQQAFASPSLMQGAEGMMQGSSNSLLDSTQADSLVPPLMMEYMSQRYEEQSMQEIEREVNDGAQDGEFQGVEAIRTDRGIILRFNDDYLFKSGSANINPNAKTKLDKIGLMICKKFILHNMKVEGHTDNQPIKSTIFPSNWELSSARASSIIRYFIARFSFMPNLFSAVGYADTRPVANNSTAEGKAKNRRVEILILKNKFRSQESATDITKLSKLEQERIQNQRMETINRISSISDAARTLSAEKQVEQTTININNAYTKEIQRAARQAEALDGNMQQRIMGEGKWLKPPARISDIKVFETKKDNNQP